MLLPIESAPVRGIVEVYRERQIAHLSDRS